MRQSHNTNMKCTLFLSLVLLTLSSWWSAEALQDVETKRTEVPSAVSVAYQDLKSAFDDTQATCDESMTAKQQELLKSIANAFGPDGLGILEVSNVPPTMVTLRSMVLDMAQTLATLPASELDEITIPSAMYSIGWSHGKEQFRGAYDTGKGSFYFDPFQDDEDATSIGNVYPLSMQPHLEDSLLELSTCMAEIGTWVASLCDLYLQQELSEGGANSLSIRQSLSGGKYAKGRLLYYFPTEGSGMDNEDDDSLLDSWCGWHKDHGALTVLIPGKIMDNDVDVPSSENVDSKAGLYIRTKGQESVHVRLPPTSIGVQLGETLEIMSRGRFRATPHAVRGSNNPKAGRASLALFLQPSLETDLPDLYREAEDDSLKQRWRPTYGAFQDATLKAFL